MRPDWGVIVGRFQVNDLHEGHMELIRQVKARHSAVLAFVGTPANKSLTQENPLDFPTIRRMINAKFPDLTVLELRDCRTDEEWSRNLDNAISSVVQSGTATLYGGRSSFVPHYKGHFTPIELNLPVQVMKISGTDVRVDCSNKVIESPEFRAGMIYAAYHQWPETKPCVDIAIFNTDETEILMVQKRGESLWRFPGGHFEHKHGSFEGTAKAEAMEETGLDITDLQYVYSGLVDDWRYASNSDKKISTVLFKAKSMTMGSRPQDVNEIGRTQWFKFSNLNEEQIVPEHRPLFHALKGKVTHATAN